MSGCTSRLPLTESRALAARPPQAEEVQPAGWGERLSGGGRVAWHVVKSQTVAVVRRPLYSTGKLWRLAREQVSEWGVRTRLTFWDFPRIWRMPIPEICPGPGFDTEAFENSLDSLTRTVRDRGELSFCADGEGFFQQLTSDIAGATSGIRAQIYIFDNDDVAVALADRLRERSGEIEVRVIFDGLGSLLAAGTRARSRPDAPPGPGDMESYLADGSQVSVRRLPNIWLAGDHNKLFVVDDRKAWLGGMNIGREYRHEWHDLMVSVTGPLVRKLSAQFDRAWEDESPAGEFSFLFEAPPPGPDAVAWAGQDQARLEDVRLLLTRPGTTQIYDAQLAALRAARRRIWLQNPYLASDAIVYELCAARHRGVDVRVILPDLCNHSLMQSSNRLAVNILRNHGVRVFAYPGMTHVKALLCDGWACFGTANFDKLSFQLNYELSLATSDRRVVEELESVLFRPDFAASRELLRHLGTLPGDRVLELIADEL